MDRMSATDAGFYFAEGENTPMHVGSVAVFDGPGALLRRRGPAAAGQAAAGARATGSGCAACPLQLGRPLWVDDEHFQILYHVRHTAVPRPGSAEQLRNLAGRVLGQRLDMAKPLWEVWLVEGLEDDRWALISKVHHCMVDGVAGTDLMQLIFDIDPDAAHARAAGGLDARTRRPSTARWSPAACRTPSSQPAQQLATCRPCCAGSRGAAGAAGGPGRRPRRGACRRPRPAARDPGRALAQRPDRPAPALGLDRDDARRRQAGPDGASAARSTTWCWPRSPAASATCWPAAAS